MSPAEILAEFKRKYESTYVFVQMPDSKEENLFFMTQIQDQGGGVGTMVMDSEDFGRIKLNTATAHTIKFMFPSVGTFQYGSDAFVFHREPRRQWQRGLCQGNCMIEKVFSKLDPKRNTRESERLSYGLVAAAFVKAHVSFREAVRMLGTGRFRSVALADGFSLVLSPTTTSDALLLHWTSAVATVKDGVVQSILEPSFEQQVRRVTQ